MIIADIITELTETATSGELRRGIQGLRDAFRIFPATLKKQMLGEYSNTEYAMLSALRKQGQTISGPVLETGAPETIFEIYNATL